VEHPAFKLDWNLVRTFVAVAQAGSLAQGARRLGITHPTAARHIQLLEESLGIALFSRTGKGLQLNEAGEALIEAAQAMHLSALNFQAVSDMTRAQPVARVRISVAGVLAELLPQIMFSQLARGDAEPVSVDMVVTDDLLNLLQRDADLALRHVRPQQTELLCRRVGTLSMGVFAVKSYIDRYGLLTAETAAEHRFVDGLERDHFIRGAARQGIFIEPAQVVIRSDSVACQRAAVDAGCGIAAFPLWMAQRYPHWVAATEPNNVIDMEVWLVARPEVRDSEQMKSLFTDLGQALEQTLAPPVSGRRKRQVTV
jgi:DNA-binding transcriptional LysR family regulator